MMRIESSVTAITWLPFGMLDALPDLPIGLAVAHYDEPPPDPLGDLDELREADGFREANELRAWIEVEGEEVVAHGHVGRGLAAGAGPDLGADQIAFPAVQFPVIRPEPETGAGWVRFQQTAGGPIGLPVPRPLRGKPYFHIGSAVAWTTLELVIYADGRSEERLVAASPFPHHSIYDADGRFVEKHGLTDYDGWYGESFEDTPWGGGELENELDQVALRSGAKLARRRLGAGEALVEHGDTGTDMFLLLDGVLEVVIEGETVAQVGSGALLGELAILGTGRRTATLSAVRASRVAVIGATEIAGSRLAELTLARRQDAGTFSHRGATGGAAKAYSPPGL
jgi:cyclic nucleotide-binding protein